MYTEVTREDGTAEWVLNNKEEVLAAAAEETPPEDFPVVTDEDVKRWNDSQYQRDREYPDIGEQLDMIYHAGLGGEEFQAAIKAVKDANPKPQE